MSTAAMIMPSDAWCVDYHKAMAGIVGVGQSVRRQASFLQVAAGLWNVNRQFKSLLVDLSKVEQARPDDLKEAIDNFRKLRSRVNYVLDLLAKRGYRNRTLVGAACYTLQQRNEELLDVIERFELTFDPSIPEALTDARSEYERGESVSLSSL